MNAPPIVLATGNSGKVRELGALLAPSDVTPAPDDFDVEETGTTLIQNALLKARALRPEVDAARLVVADDTGLVVHALGGRPGVFSARYAGPDATYEDNCRRLIDEMDGETDRGAAFVCVLVALAADGDMCVACGTVSGTITTAMRGANGFGYDPVFQPVGGDETMAEMSTEAKSAISHRGRAARRLASAIASAR